MVEYNNNNNIVAEYIARIIIIKHYQRIIFHYTRAQVNIHHVLINLTHFNKISIFVNNKT